MFNSNYNDVLGYDLDLKDTIINSKQYTKFMKQYLTDLRTKLQNVINMYKDVPLSEQSLYLYKERYYLTYPDGSKDESPSDVWRRVARTIASADTYYTASEDLLHLEEELIYDMLQAKLFLPNSPILFNAGKGIQKSYFTKLNPTYDDYLYIRNHNITKATSAACFVLEVEDNLNSIMDTLKNIALISGAGGGIGLNFAKLRPEFSYISSGGYSSGALSFLKTYNELGENILEGGIRRFAGMAVFGFANLDDDNFQTQPISFHPDTIDFIKIKQNNTGISQLRNFNISIGINNSMDFLDKINTNSDISLEFKHKTLSELINKDEFYSKIYNKLDNEKKKSVDIKLSGKISAKTIFNEIVNNAWNTGDPGLVFLDKANKYNPLSKYIQITATNPCGERPNLSSSKYNMITPCNLLSIDVSKFAYNKQFDYESLSYTAQIGLHALDLIIDLMMYPTPEVQKGALLLRDAGLGLMGLHGAMILQNIAYASNEGRAFAYYVMKDIEVSGSYMSWMLGKYKYPFLVSDKTSDVPIAEIWANPNTEYEKFTNTYVETLYQQLRAKPKNHQLRNCTITSVAPTGTLSQLIQIESLGDVGSGIEPLFALKYDRYITNKDGASKTVMPYVSKLLNHVIKNNEELEAVTKYIEKNNTIVGIEKAYKNLSFDPKILYTALDINYLDHLKMLEAVQYSCSSSVSKTINLKKSATKKDVEDIFIYAIASPVIKGITIYRDGSLQYQVLNTEKKEEKSLFILDNKGKIHPKERPVVIESLKQKITITNGKELSFYLELGLDTNNEPFELFIRPTNSTKEYTSLFNAIGRLSSLAIRSNISIDEVLVQIKKIKDWKNEYDNITSIIADGVNSLLLIAKNRGKKRVQNVEEINTTKQNWKLVSDGYYIDGEGKLRCPVCGSEIVKQEGCATCPTCGWSACS
ncbi:MAG: adenosylcobalamin-dependent ribonucleoside-diphosphate reductase [Candidatus Micrarchaeaceae archaeon]